jgi:hypothetical protein
MDYLDQIIKEFVMPKGVGVPQQSLAPIQPIDLIQAMGVAGPQSPAPQQQVVGGQLGVGAPQSGMGQQQIVGGQPGPMGQVGQALGMSNAGPLLGATAAYQNTQNRRTAGIPGLAGGMMQTGEAIFDAIQEPKKRRELEIETDLAAARQQSMLNQQELKQKQAILKQADAAREIGMQVWNDPDKARNIAQAVLNDPTGEVFQKFMEQVGALETDIGTEEHQNAVNMGLKPGSPGYNQYIKRVTTPQGTNVTVKNEGNLKSGEQFVRDENGEVIAVREIPGGAAEEERLKEERAAQRNWRHLTQNADFMIEDARHALDLVGFDTTGLVGDVMSRISGTSATDLEAVLTTLKANIGFDRLQQMRNASVTGGALGNVSNREIELLYNSMAPLGLEGPDGKPGRKMSAREMERSLKRIMTAYERIKHVGMDEELRVELENMSDKEYWDYWKSMGLGRDGASTDIEKPKPLNQDRVTDLNAKYGTGQAR